MLIFALGPDCHTWGDSDYFPVWGDSVYRARSATQWTGGIIYFRHYPNRFFACMWSPAIVLLGLGGTAPSSLCNEVVPNNLMAFDIKKYKG